MSEKTKIDFQNLANMKSYLAEEFVGDELNPHFLFSDVRSELLLAIEAGELDVLDLVRDQLAGRGFNRDGKWVGFDRSAEIFKVGL